MSVAFLPFSKGQSITVVSFDALTISGTTITAAGTPVNIKGYLHDGSGYEGEIETEQVRPITASRKNPVPIVAGTTYTFAELVRDGAGGAILDGMFYGASLYYRLVYTRGGKTHTADVLMTKCTESPDPAKIAAIGTFETFDNGQANPAIS